MQKAPIDTLAILRGEQRSARYRYRHTVAAAAREVGIPTAWVWSWLHSLRLKHQTWLRRIWVRLGDAQELFRDLQAVHGAFYATYEPLASPAAVRQALSRWPYLPQEMWKAPDEIGAPWTTQRAA